MLIMACTLSIEERPTMKFTKQLLKLRDDEHANAAQILYLI